MEEAQIGSTDPSNPLATLPVSGRSYGTLGQVICFVAGRPKLPNCDQTEGGQTSQHKRVIGSNPTGTIASGLARHRATIRRASTCIHSKRAVLRKGWIEIKAPAFYLIPPFRFMPLSLTI